MEETGEDLRLLLDEGEVLVALVEAVAQALDAAADHGERRPELVRHVGEELAPPGLVALEPLGHRVERPRELAHLARTVLGRSRREVALAHASGGVHHVADRSRRAPEEAPEDGDADRDERVEEQDAGERASAAGRALPAPERAAGEPPDDEDEHHDREEREPDPPDEAAPHLGPVLAARGVRFALGPPRRAAVRVLSPAPGAVLVTHRRTGSRRRAR